MSEARTISKSTDTRDDRDFSFLRSEGLRHIEELSRKLWTDYNLHDPGITMLEALSYAITDLGNRINQPMRNLVTRQEGNENKLAGSFPSAREILTTGPVSIADYRKLFIDIENVNNVFIYRNTDYELYRHCLKKDETSEDDPAGKLSMSDSLDHYEQLDSFTLKGLYDIYFEPVHDIKAMPDDSSERQGHIGNITNQIKQRYHANRNLCEDLGNVQEVNYFDVLVCGDIEIERSASASEVMAEIVFRVQEYFSPFIGRHSLSELLEQNIGVENIFEGPVLENGFILDDELNKANKRREIYLSDLVQIVMETPGVVDIRKLKIGPCGDEEALEEITDTKNHKWTICLPDQPNIVPRLCRTRSLARTNLYKDVIPVPVDDDRFEEKLNQKTKERREERQLTYDDLPADPGIPVDTETYRSVQNELPPIYGTGEYGLSPKLPPGRHAKARQLKGYLMFFDQILATYFGHLHSISDLLSAEVGSKSYFAGIVENVQDSDALLRYSDSHQSRVDELLSSLDDFEERKNQFLDHLLGRFAENMNDYAFAMLENFGDDVTGATLWHKSILLQEYPKISYNRARGFNYLAGGDEAWDTDQVTGLEHRLARLLGIRNYSRRDITVYNFDIYLEEDDDELDEWRWRIKNNEGDILFSSSTRYPSKEAARQELWITVSLAWNPENYHIKQTEDEEEYYFNIVDQSGEVVARHMRYFDSQEEAQTQIERLTKFIYDEVAEEGLYCFENILLRPEPSDTDADDKLMPICMDRDCVQCRPFDPYSLRLTIVLPGWTRRFSNMYFREYAEDLIRREVPAHILCRICWIGNTGENEEGEESTSDGPMAMLQQKYRQWLTHKMEHPASQKENEHLKPLVDLLHDLETVYPAGILHDCENAGEDEPDPSIILGQSTIGELKRENHGNE